jgi:hypothetical protein
VKSPDTLVSDQDSSATAMVTAVTKIATSIGDIVQITHRRCVPTA